MDIEKQILSDITIHMKYAKFLPELNRRETWEEIVERNREMHLRKYKHLGRLGETIDWVYDKFVHPKKVLPSMRSMQFAGKAIEVNPIRMYNCSYLPIDSVASFHEVIFLLLCGCGVGFSCQSHHVRNLPEIRKPNINRTRRFLIADSIEGWSDAVKVLFKSYFGIQSSYPIFDFREIRPKGTLLRTSGGIAPGPQPLKECLVIVQGILDEKKDGDKLTTLEVHDIICHISDAVLAGGIRRSALISMFSADDNLMMTAKAGGWWEKDPQRGRANNSALLLRHRITKDYFFNIWEKIHASGSGEPGVYLSNDKDWSCNPCGEISLRPYQFCNLTEINASDIEDQHDLEERVMAASILGTLQAGYTDFHYIRDIWKRNTEKDALLGISMTGIASNRYKGLDLPKAVQVAADTNAELASVIGINKATRITSVKPAGTTSLALGTSSGIHAWYDEYYIRRVRVSKEEAIYKYLNENLPALLEDDYFRPHDRAIICVPQKAPEGASLRHESPIETLERIKYFYENWIKPGFRSGQNGHSISATIFLKSGEWDEVGKWMWDNKDVYNGLSILPYDGGTYVQAPFETCTKEKYEEMLVHLKEIDLSQVKDFVDRRDLRKDAAACSGNNCEIV